jgi:glycosyltransferase involved in cell wall biosynthesis
MKILLIAQPHSSHTLKISNSLSNMGHKVIVCGIGNDSLNIYYNKDIIVYNLNINKKVIAQKDGSLSKLSYFMILPKLKAIVKTFKPDIINSHYASSNGLLGYLLRHKHFVVSVWGSDIYDFPNQNFIYKIILKIILNSAKIIFSTSKIMAKETAKYTSKQIVTIPFGVDTEKFKPILTKKPDIVTIGIIKWLEKYYGIEYLLEATKILVDRKLSVNFRVLIIGKGSLELQLKQKAKDLEIEQYVEFTGYVSYAIIEQFHNMLDIACYPSIEESFGVSVLESSACQLPVVASEIGGIPELIIDGITGFLVKPKNSLQLADKLQILLTDENLREQMGKEGRNFVVNNFSWNNSIEKMIHYYNLVINNSL